MRDDEQISVGDQFIVEVEGDAVFPRPRDKEAMVRLLYGTRIEVTAYRELKNGRFRATCRVMPTKLDRSLPRKRALAVLMHSELYETTARVLEVYGLRRLSPLECLAHESE